MRNFYTLFVLLFTINISAQEYILPIDNVSRLTGNFGEIRSNHIHTGLDISTNYVEGKPVYAVQDGYVSRIKISPYGYGYALYIDHPDGHTTVYGHLSSYNKKIENYVRNIQYKNKAWDMDVYPSPEDLPVKQGEVIALSGNSGSSGGPHLHFEVRDTKTERALNPLAFIPQIEDKTYPKIKAVKLYALDDNSSVDGEKDEYKNYTKNSLPVFYCVGKIGIGIQVDDYFTTDGRPVGIVDLHCYYNNQEVFHSYIDSIDFDKQRNTQSFIDFADKDKSHRYIQRCIVDPNNDLQFYDIYNPINVSVGDTALLTVLATDFAGNQSKAAVKIIGKEFEPRKPMNLPIVHYNQDFTVDRDDIKINIPAGSLFDDIYFHFKVEDSPTYHKIYTISNYHNPLKKSISVEILDIDHIDLPEKTFIATLLPNNVILYNSTTFTGTSFKADISQFGNYTLKVDTIPPKIKSYKNVVLSDEKIVFQISDDLSGIKSFSVEIDGQWQPFEYEPKKDQLRIAPKYINLKNGTHHAIVYVCDNSENCATLQFDFTLEP